MLPSVLSSLSMSDTPLGGSEYKTFPTRKAKPGNSSVWHATAKAKDPQSTLPWLWCLGNNLATYCLMICFWESGSSPFPVLKQTQQHPILSNNALLQRVADHPTCLDHVHFTRLWASSLQILSVLSVQDIVLCAHPVCMFWPVFSKYGHETKAPGELIKKIQISRIHSIYSESDSRDESLKSLLFLNITGDYWDTRL